MASKNPSGREQTVANRIAGDKKNLLEHLRRTPIVLHATKLIDIGRTTYYDWHKRDAKFAKDADEAIREGIELMNEVVELQLFSLMKEKKFEPIRFWLTHRHPAYANKLELSGTVTTRKKQISPERRALMKRALRYSSVYGKKRKKN